MTSLPVHSALISRRCLKVKSGDGVVTGWNPAPKCSLSLLSRPHAQLSAASHLLFRPKNLDNPFFSFFFRSVSRKRKSPSFCAHYTSQVSGVYSRDFLFFISPIDLKLSEGSLWYFYIKNVWKRCVCKRKPFFRPQFQINQSELFLLFFFTFTSCFHATAGTFASKEPKAAFNGFKNHELQMLVTFAHGSATA